MREDILKDAEKDTRWLSIFRKVAIIGDSLSSGEFVALDEAGNYDYYDHFDYSWGQFMARKYGFTAYNFSRGGMTAKEYLNGFADRNHMFAPEYAAQAYFIALGVNDFNTGIPLGAPEDETGADTFAGQIKGIVARYRNIQPRAVFFFVTMPKTCRDSAEERKKKAAHRALLYGIAEGMAHAYVVDLFAYAPEYDEAFERRHWMNGHMTPSGYLLTAEYISRLTDALIDEHMEEFREVGFIGTDLWEKR